MYPPYPVAEQIHKKMAAGGYASKEDFFIEMESYIYDSDLHLQRYYFLVSGEVVDKRGLVRQAPDSLLVKYELLISEAIHGIRDDHSHTLAEPWMIPCGYAAVPRSLQLKPSSAIPMESISIKVMHGAKKAGQI